MTILILAQTLVPLSLLGWLAFVPPRNRLGLGMQALMTAIAMVALARLGVWVFPPWWTPYLYGVLLMLALGLSLPRHQPQRQRPSSWLVDDYGLRGFWRVCRP
jgi:alkylation response protein AidB-like acyl-CoA dehydrogenase